MANSVNAGSAVQKEPEVMSQDTQDPSREIVEAINNVTLHPRTDHGQMVRIIEALLFASSEPLSDESLLECLPDGADLEPVMATIAENYAERGVNLVNVADRWMFRTAEDLSFLLRREATAQKRLSKAALETIAIIAYHQPVTRAEIEEIRGVSISKGTLDILLEMGWAKLRGRRRTPGKPVTYGTTQEFLEHFGLANISDLPGLSELKGAGLLSSNLPSGFSIPMPRDEDDLGPDEMGLDDDYEEPPLEMHLPDLSEDDETFDSENEDEPLRS